jgi:hypothetical protein
LPGPAIIGLRIKIKDTIWISILPGKKKAIQASGVDGER